jgi:hypothetical protein
MGPVNNSTASLISPTVLDNASVYVAVTPKLVFNPQVSAWKLISLGFDVDTGLKGQFIISARPNAVMDQEV